MNATSTWLQMLPLVIKQGLASAFWFNLMCAALFGLGSPVLVATLCRWRWWLFWFVVGLALFAWPVGRLFTEEDDGRLGYVVGVGVVVVLMLPSVALFVLSFLARAFWLPWERGKS